MGTPPADYIGTTRYDQAYVTNAYPIILPIGLVNTPAAVREILNQPPPEGDTNVFMSGQRYYNKAGVALLISNTTITAVLKYPTNDPAPTTIRAEFYPTNNAASNYLSVVTNFPFLSVTNYWATNPAPIWDQREHAVLKLTDIDVSILKRWLVTNALLNTIYPNADGVYPDATNAPNVLYVADNRTPGAAQLTAVRLKNAQIIPTNLFVFGGSNAPSGFTVATPNPLYIYGNYNCPDTGQLGTTNTSSSFPASLLCDALTILSPNWRDSQSAKSLTDSTKSTAISTTVNAAIVAGTVYSTGPAANQFSGGVQNLPRLLEDWSAAKVTLTLNTSLVNLYDSADATNQWQPPGTYYYAPTRQFSFDPNFTVSWKLPPGTPGLQSALPYIVTQPQNQTVVPGQTAAFSVWAIGDLPLSYQWSYPGPADHSSFQAPPRAASCCPPSPRAISDLIRSSSAIITQA